MKLFLKSTAVGFSLMASVVAFTSCNNEQKDSKEVAEEKNEAKADSTKQFAEKDAQFIVDVVAANYGEVKLAQLAQQKSANAEIKGVAKTLESDHTAVLNELKDLASTKGISVPTEETQDAKDKYKDLNEKKGKDFDKEWCETLVDKHEKSIKKFEDASNEAVDPDLKAWAAKTIPKLQAHHDKLMQCEKKLKS